MIWMYLYLNIGILYCQIPNTSIFLKFILFYNIILNEYSLGQEVLIIISTFKQNVTWKQVYARGCLGNSKQKLIQFLQLPEKLNCSVISTFNLVLLFSTFLSNKTTNKSK